MISLSEEFNERAMELKFKGLKAQFAEYMQGRESILGKDPKAVGDAAEKFGEMTDKMTEADMKGTLDKVYNIFNKWLEMGGVLEPFLAWFELVLAVHKAGMADVLAKLWEIMFSAEAVATAKALGNAMSRMNDWMRILLGLEGEHTELIQAQANFIRDLIIAWRDLNIESGKIGTIIGSLTTTVGTFNIDLGILENRISAISTMIRNMPSLGGGSDGGGDDDEYAWYDPRRYGFP